MSAKLKKSKEVCRHLNLDKSKKDMLLCWTKQKLEHCSKNMDNALCELAKTVKDRANAKA